MADARTYQNLITPVTSVLAFFGKSTEHRGYMYFSPFHDETSPSMHVKVNADGTWVWADFSMSASNGNPLGGGCLDLVKELASRDARYSERKPVDILREIAGATPSEVYSSRSIRSRVSSETGAVVDSVNVGVVRRSLLSYGVFKRCIPESLLNRYCSEVSYHPVAKPGRSFYAIGFRNDADGWVIRSAGKRGKLNVGHACVTTLDKNGAHVKGGSPSSSSLYLFEGFMDFLSFLAWCGYTVPGVDAVILHSTSLVGMAKDWVQQHGEVRCFFDNDKAGTVATEIVRGWCEEKDIRFMDGRTAYKEHNDINEAWQAVCAVSRDEQMHRTLKRSK